MSTTEKSFSVAAGDAINVAMTLDAGKLLVSGVYAPGGAEDRERFCRRDPQSAGAMPARTASGSRPTTRRCRSSSFPSGSYDVVATVGFAKRVTRAEVRSGAPTRIEVNLDAGTPTSEPATAR